MWNNNRLCKLLDIDHPIIQAPMAGTTSPEMVAAASNAGALGSLASAFSTIEECEADIKAVKSLTNQAFNVNFFTHTPPENFAIEDNNLAENLANWSEKLEVEQLPAITESNFPFDAKMCDALCNNAPKVASFHFGLPDQNLVRQMKEKGILILSSATSVKEAVWLEEHGADAIIAQGFEAGGHSGWFLPRGEDNLTGSMALIPRIVDSVSLPVIAAGGIADGRGIAAALTLGADGVQIGTAFVTTSESVTSDIHKDAIMNASGDDTMHTKAFSGRKARTVSNAYARSMSNVDTFPDFPLMNTVTAPIRKASIESNSPDATALWAGQAAGLNRRTSTEELIFQLVNETWHALKIRN